MSNNLVFNDIEVSKNQFYDSKEAILLNSVNVENIIVSNKVKNNNETYNILLDIVLMILLHHCVLFYYK